jgi:hypothetical protein
MGGGCIDPLVEAVLREVIIFIWWVGRTTATVA